MKTDILHDCGTNGAFGYTAVFKVLLTFVLAIQLVACGGGGGGSGSGSGGSAAGASSGGSADVASPVQISGSVGDGPVTGATIVVYSAKGSELGAMTSDATASFGSTIKAKGRDYPLLIKATGGFDLVTGAAPSFEMLSVTFSPRDKRQNINPFTTLTVRMAQLLPGGLTADNVKTARTTVMDKLGFGLDPNLIPDPITTSIDATRAANIIKASEALAEMVRRTAAIVSGAGAQLSGDGVVTALAADLTDGKLDGRGAPGADARIATVAEVVSAQVLVEALRNELRVDGLVATGTLDQAIRTTQPGISDAQLTSGVRVTAGMLDEAKVAVAAARVLDSSSQVADIATGIGSIAANVLPTTVKQVLSADATTYLENAVTLSSRATSQQMTSIGQVVAGGSVGSSSTGSTGGSGSTGSSSGTTTPTNHAPVISGSPAGTVVAGSAYSFQPSASDADGNTLGFSISNKPSWASFSATTGKLSGTPGTGNVGTYGNIVIKVSDGTASASLPAFSIQVAAAPTQSATTGTITLKWKAPVARADGTPLSLADIDGYRIHYGKSTGNYPNQVDVPDGTAQSVTLTDVPLGATYYIVLSTYDVDGRESGYSAVVSKNLQ
jgi:hypothetical protein